MNQVLTDQKVAISQQTSSPSGSYSERLSDLLDILNVTDGRGRYAWLSKHAGIGMPAAKRWLVDMTGEGCPNSPSNVLAFCERVLERHPLGISAHALQQWLLYGRGLSPTRLREMDQFARNEVITACCQAASKHGISSDTPEGREIIQKGVDRLLKFYCESSQRPEQAKLAIIADSIFTLIQSNVLD